jgi:glycosyltransferase involved in cell wall biosynthesis
LAHRHPDVKVGTGIITLTIDWYLPGTNSGGPVRSIANLVSALPEIDFYIITRNTDYCSTAPYAGIPSNTWVQQGVNVWVYYFSEDQLTKGKMKEVIQGTNAGSLYVSGIYSRAFSQWPVSIGKSLGIKTIVAARGMLSPHALAVKPLKKYVFLSFMRWINAYEHVSFHATSDEEAKDIQTVIGKRAKVSVLANVARQEAANIQEIVKEQGSVKLVSIGRIAPEKGTLHGIKALQDIQGTVELDLYGTCYNTDYWKQCEQVISQLPANIQVRYNGVCPTEEVSTKLAAAHALLLPSEGENFGHAIVESFAQGRPAIISKHTPWKSLSEAQAGWDVDNHELSTVIQTLVSMNNEAYQTWSKGASRFAQERIVNTQGDLLEEYYNVLISDKCSVPSAQCSVPSD